MEKQIPEGYKQTEVGVIPEDWSLLFVGQLVNIKTGKKNTQDRVDEGRYPFFVRSQTIECINTYSYDEEAILTAGDGVGTGKVFHYINGKFECHQRVYILSPANELIHGRFFFYFFSHNFFNRIIQMTAKTSVDSVRKEMIYDMPIILPTPLEQKAIATALSDVDNLISSLEQLIEKKKAIKQGTMQELLTGRRRLPGFGEGKGYKQTELGMIPEDWEVKELGEIIECLDNQRIPLSEVERRRIKGDIPYCGANGVLDFINDYIFNDDILLLAEDGGYYDEFEIRPIAYRMIGKCWVNNHAHVIKALQGYSQDFLYYLLVNRNIMEYLASGTRAKLNKSQMLLINVVLPISLLEQSGIAQILSDMDSEIEKLETKVDKYKQIKQGMMQNLLTGRIRLV